MSPLPYSRSKRSSPSSPSCDEVPNRLYQSAHDRAREALGDDAYQAAAIAGPTLTLEQALAEAETVLQLNRNGRAGGSPAP
jgi:hypothetical protein